MGESEAVQNNVHHWLTNQYLNNPNNTLSLKTIGALVYWDQGTSRLITWHWLNQFVVRFLCSTIHQQYVLQFFACFCFFFSEQLLRWVSYRGKRWNQQYLPWAGAREFDTSNEISRQRTSSENKTDQKTHTMFNIWNYTGKCLKYGGQVIWQNMLRILYYCCSFPLTSVNQHLQDDLAGQEKWLWNEMEMERVWLN